MDIMEEIKANLLRITKAHIKVEEAQLKTDQSLTRLEIRLDKQNKKWESFMGNSAQITEEYFYRSLEKDKTLGKLKFYEIDRNIRKTSHHVEYDIILINGDSIGIIEVKNKAHPKDIKPLIEKKIKHFKLDYPQYEEYKYYFGIATMITNEQMIQEAKESGIFLLTQNANHLEIVNEGVNTF